MTQSTKYSFQQLQQIKQDIESFMGREEKLPTALAYNLRKNKKKIDSSLDLITEDFKELSETDQKTMQEFQDERLALIKEYGGEIEEVGNGQAQVTNVQELNSNADFVSDFEELKEEYGDLLEVAESNDKYNFEMSHEEVADVDFASVSIETFPERVSDFPESFLNFVTD